MSATPRDTEHHDTLRQVIVIVSTVLAIIGAFIGSGAAGGQAVQIASGGALAADATPIAPDGPAFSIWSVIYLGLVAYAIWQALPAQRRAERHRRLGYWIAASLLLNAAWILSVQFDLLPLSVPVIVLLLVVLVRSFTITLATRPTNLIDTVVTDGTVGLYLGWVCVATAANVAAVLTDAGFRGFGLGLDTWGVVITAVAGAIGVALAIRGRGRIAPTLSLSWGLAWVAVARLTGDLESTPTAVTAILAVVVVVAATVAMRVRERRSPTLAPAEPGATRRASRAPSA